MKALTEGEAIITVTSAVNENVFKEIEVNVKNLVKNKTYNKMVIPLDKKNKTRKLSRTSKVKSTYLKLSSSRKALPNRGRLPSPAVQTRRLVTFTPSSQGS